MVQTSGCAHAKSHSQPKGLSLHPRAPWGQPQSQQLSTAPAPKHSSTSICFHPWGCAPPKTVSRVSPSPLPDSSCPTDCLWVGACLMSPEQPPGFLLPQDRGFQSQGWPTARTFKPQRWDRAHQLLAGRRRFQIPPPGRHGHGTAPWGRASPKLSRASPAFHRGHTVWLPGSGRALCSTFPAHHRPAPERSAEPCL